MNQLTALLMHLVAPGVWAASGLFDSDKRLALAQGEPLVLVDFSGVADKNAMMETLAEDLGFGGYFGKNFDALEECLHDLQTDSKVVVITNGDDLARSEPRTMATLNAILEDVAAKTDRSFVWVSDSDLNVPVIPNFWT